MGSRSRRCRSFAIVCLGLSSEEAEKLSVNEFIVLERRWKIKEAREDARFAMLAFTIANCSGAKKEDGSSFKFVDFMPRSAFDREEEEEQTPEQMIAILQGMVNHGNSR
jgi:hypothetical protein